MIKLKKIILNYKNKESDFSEIINYFSKTITTLSKKFKISELKWDLNSYLWEVIAKLNVNNFDSDKAIYSYIYRCLYNYCLTKVKQHNVVMLFDSELTDFTLNTLNYGYSDLNSTLIFDDLISGLSDKQQLILSLRYKYCLSDNEISNLLNISRQAVCKNRNISLNKLTKCLSN